MARADYSCISGCHACAVETNGHVAIPTHAQCLLELSENLVLLICLAKCSNPLDLLGSASHGC